MQTFKVLSLLMSYPRDETIAALPEMSQVLERERLLTGAARAEVFDLMLDMGDADLLDLQEEYVALFDRGRALSLHIYEHLHGESRDRGQAMVNLIDHYRANGFEIDARELPDYIPLFLEYLSQRPLNDARELLTDAMHVFSLLGARLAERRSPYWVLFQALEAIAGEPEDVAQIRQKAAGEGPDETIVRMDEIWEEEAVTFMPGPGGCPAQQQMKTGAAQPVRFVPRTAAQ